MDESANASFLNENEPAVLDPVDLERRLQRLSSRSSSPDWEQYRIEFHRDETFAYNCLELEGAIPSHPLEIYDDAVKTLNHTSPIIRYWAHQTRRSTDLYISQLQYWRDFRDYQKNAREHFYPGARFPKYRRTLDHYRQVKELPPCTEPVLEREIRNQSRLATWLEYQDWNVQQLIAEERRLAAQKAKLNSVLDARKEASLPVYRLEPPEDGTRYGIEELPSFEQDIKRTGAMVERLGSEIASTAKKIQKHTQRKDLQGAQNLQVMLSTLISGERRTRSQLRVAKKKLSDLELRKQIVSNTYHMHEARYRLNERKLLCDWIEEQRVILSRDEEKSNARSRVIFSQHVFPRPGADSQSLDEDAVLAASLGVLHGKTVAEIKARKASQLLSAMSSVDADHASPSSSRAGRAPPLDSLQSDAVSKFRQKRSSSQPRERHQVSRVGSSAKAQVDGEGQHASNNGSESPTQASTAQKIMMRQHSQVGLAAEIGSESSMPRGRPQKPRGSKKIHATPLAKTGSPQKRFERRRALSSSRPDPPAGIRRSTRKRKKPDFFRPG